MPVAEGSVTDNNLQRSLKAHLSNTMVNFLGVTQSILQRYSTMEITLDAAIWNRQQISNPVLFFKAIRSDIKPDCYKSPVSYYWDLEIQCFATLASAFYPANTTESDILKLADKARREYGDVIDRVMQAHNRHFDFLNSSDTIIGGVTVLGWRGCRVIPNTYRVQGSGTLFIEETRNLS